MLLSMHMGLLVYYRDKNPSSPKNLKCLKSSFSDSWFVFCLLWLLMFFKEGYVSMVAMGDSLGHSAGQLHSMWNVDPKVLIS